MDDINLPADAIKASVVLLPLLNTVGKALSLSPKVRNSFIPFALLGLGALAMPAYLGWTSKNAVLGSLVGMGAVTANQFFRQGAQVLRGENPPAPAPLPPEQKQ